ncbi:MAG TPA: caspase family protein, partial [Dongiaceae bacterium]|nr:caspase family protein [Dongiaceae bacterium]
MMTIRKLFPALAAALALLCAPAAHAQTRRALLIGINEYDKPPAGGHAGTPRATGRGKIGPLGGSVNDAKAMRDVLTGRYGFLPANVKLITNASAARDSILKAIAELTAASNPGDIIVFFYAGHGSMRRNTGRPGSDDDKLDQTIVPVDANFGAEDIRDKEIARAFWPLAQKNVVLTLIFDACHSGTITRGEPTTMKYRFADIDTNDVKDPIPAPPLDSVALHISSVQDYQGAPEKPDENGVDHGVFTAALVKVLGSGAPNASAEEVYREVRAMVRSDGSSSQEPVMDGPAWRLTASLIDGGKSPVSGRVTVPVIRVIKDSDDTLVEIQGGLALGVRESTELRPSDTASGMSRLTVVGESGLDRSTASVIKGTGKKPAPGTMYEVEKWGVAPAGQLKVWMPPAISAAGLASAVAQVKALRATAGVA